MKTWLINNSVGIISFIVSSFIAYHLYFLSKKINLKDRLARRSEIQKKIEPVLARIEKGSGNRVELINVEKYQDSYPHSNKLTREGYTYIGAELKSLRFDGVEFFCGIREVYRKTNGELTLDKIYGGLNKSFNVFETGIIPYEWIEYIDTKGDEFSYRPQFFVHFKGKNK